MDFTKWHITLIEEVERLLQEFFPILAKLALSLPLLVSPAPDLWPLTRELGFWLNCPSVAVVMGYPAFKVL
jgi:hypothetical protein